MSKFDMNKRLKELQSIFDKVEPEKVTVIENLIDNMVFLESQMSELKAMPMIKKHPRDPSRQKRTEAAKLYKEALQSYKDAVRILLGVLNKVDNSAQDELLAALAKFQ